MYAFEIYNKKTNEHDFAYGYSIEDMKRRNPSVDWATWKIIHSEYVD